MGETSRVYTWAFDAANPSWQDYVVQVLSYYVQDLGVDGFRFDAPTWNCMPNWDRDLPRRASASYYGAATLFDKARRALKALNRRRGDVHRAQRTALSPQRGPELQL